MTTKRILPMAVFFVLIGGTLSAQTRPPHSSLGAQYYLVDPAALTPKQKNAFYNCQQHVKFDRGYYFFPASSVGAVNGCLKKQKPPTGLPLIHTQAAAQFLHHEITSVTYGLGCSDHALRLEGKSFVTLQANYLNCARDIDNMIATVARETDQFNKQPAVFLSNLGSYLSPPCNDPNTSASAYSLGSCLAQNCYEGDSRTICSYTKLPDCANQYENGDKAGTNAQVNELASVRSLGLSGAKCFMVAGQSHCRLKRFHECLEGKRQFLVQQGLW